MEIRVYLPGGIDTALHYVPEGMEVLDLIFLEYGLYLEFDII